jgi:flagellar FliL protein
MGNGLLIGDEASVALPAVERRGRRPSKMMWIAIAAAAVVLIAGIVGVMLWRGGSGTHDGAAGASSSTYVDAPAMVVNMRSADGQTHFLKLRFVLVAASAGKVALINQRMPVVVDSLQSFLRELRPEDLNGSAAVFRVKEEMMIRAQDVLGQGSVRDILIQDMVEQ